MEAFSSRHDFCVDKCCDSPPYADVVALANSAIMCHHGARGKRLFFF